MSTRAERIEQAARAAVDSVAPLFGHSSVGSVELDDLRAALAEPVEAPPPAPRTESAPKETP